MRILRLSITALVALVAVSAAILLTGRIQEEPPPREVSMTAPAAAAPAPTTSSTSTSTSTTTSTTEPPTTTTTWLPVPTTAPPVPTVPPAPTTTWVEPEPEPEPEYVPEPEPQYEPSGSGCVIPAYICERESGHSYTALNASSGAGGMYQFMPSTWRAVANQIAPEWANTAPHQAPPWVQDMFATYLWDGGRGCYHWSAC